jgi:hypothetical protein
VLRIRIWCFFTPESAIRDLGWKNPDLGSGIHIPDHISESSAKNCWVKNTYILCCGSGSGIRCLFDPGSATLGTRKIIIVRHVMKKKTTGSTGTDKM